MLVAPRDAPDGPGPQDLVVEDIQLAQNKTYEMAISLDNTIEGESITEEIEEEAEEHQFFFGWTGDVFTDPMGDGNIDNSLDPLNYNDADENGNPVGLSTEWTTSSSSLTGGTFTVRLQHQPDIKTSTTGANDGDTDFDLEFVLNIQ